MYSVKQDWPQGGVPQITMNLEDVQKTALITPFELFENK